MPDAAKTPASSLRSPIELTERQNDVDAALLALDTFGLVRGARPGGVRVAVEWAKELEVTRFSVVGCPLIVVPWS